MALQEAFNTCPFWILCLAKLCDFYCLISIITHIIPYGIGQRLQPATAVSCLSVIGVSSIIGGFCWVLLSTTQVQNITYGSASPCSSQAWFFSSLLSKPWFLFLYAPFYGIAHGGFFLQRFQLLLVFSLIGTMDRCLELFFSGAVDGTTGPVLIARIFDIQGNYDNAFLIFIGSALLGFFLPEL